ncbi:hypothetical protein K2Z84_05235 [Candidatus Binatia bacterium]|nr:hypothetical protein [Candidatus Binatia bacterium]
MSTHEIVDHAIVTAELLILLVGFVVVIVQRDRAQAELDKLRTEQRWRPRT